MGWIIKPVSKWKLKVWPWKLQFRFGWDGQKEKLLHEYFYKMKRESIPIFLRNPLQIRNWIVSNTKWTSDKEAYGSDEHWPQIADDLYHILETGKDDCDGLAVLAASMLHTLGNKYVRLAVGYYGIGDHSLSNHVYCVLFDSIENPDDPFLIETTGDEQVAVLPRLRMSPLYKTKLICDSTGNYWEIC